ncbi:copper resistance protein NlpE [Shewanella algidipiscicola]|uniref:Copper resistance protein n=1 Tax=Shewanella algidipiscicola TaxID=614070 RepID=A0ABQ4PKA9_9GAMM|nr:copper resistance protein NlpE [Shewanella algidipiscicola]GIU47565.1 copper resistance protein [Shewanella algidipiscicola]
MKPQLILFGALTLAACNPESPAPAAPTASEITSESAVSIGDNSQNALDWPGEYSGVLPCASCGGIETHLVLNADLSYRLTQRYLGESDEPIIEEGNFTWNERGSAISLTNDATPMQFQVGENQLFMLDQDGKRITGALAEHYRLAKNQ